MSNDRSRRLKEAGIWWKEQHFAGGDHIIKAYRKRFHVDRVCAMRDLLKLGVLDPETREEYRGQLQKRKERSDLKRKEKARRAEEKKKGRPAGNAFEEWQDDTFAFIAGYTSGGFPYGILWEEEDWTEEGEGKTGAQEEDPMDDPGYLEYLESLMENDLQESRLING